jgi:hypothetical protein
VQLTKIRKRQKAQEREKKKVLFLEVISQVRIKVELISCRLALQKTL